MRTNLFSCVYTRFGGMCVCVKHVLCCFRAMFFVRGWLVVVAVCHSWVYESGCFVLHAE